MIKHKNTDKYVECLLHVLGKLEEMGVVGSLCLSLGETTVNAHISLIIINQASLAALYSSPMIYSSESLINLSLSSLISTFVNSPQSLAMCISFSAFLILLARDSSVSVPRLISRCLKSSIVVV